MTETPAAAPETPTPSSQQPPATPPASPTSPTPQVDPNAAPVVDPNAPKIWGEDLDDELKTFVGDKTPAQVAKELKGAQTLLGKKTIGIPTKDSTPEEWKAFHEARGVPKDEAGYDFKGTLEELMKDAPEGVTLSPEREAEFRALAKAANLDNGTANELIKRQLAKEWGSSKEALAQIATANKQAATMLDEKWGAKKDEYTQDANRFARHIGLDDTAIDAFMKVAGTKPEVRVNFVNFMREQGALLREGGDGGPIVPVGGEALTPAQATEKKQAFLSIGDNQEAYLDPAHPRHKTVYAAMQPLLKAERGIN
jgi:hypothetical protein